MRRALSPSLPSGTWFTFTSAALSFSPVSASTQQTPSAGAKNTLPELQIAPWMPPVGRWNEYAGSLLAFALTGVTSTRPLFGPPPSIQAEYPTLSSTTARVI